MQFSKLSSFIAVAMLVAVVFVGLVTVATGAVQSDTAQAGTPQSPGWKFRADLANTGVYDDGGVRPNNLLKWNFTTGGPVSSSPAVANGVVYVEDAVANLYALNATNGAKLWNFTTNDDFSSPAVANGVVYIGSQFDDCIYAINATTGAMLRNYTTDYEYTGAPWSSLAVVNGVVYAELDSNAVFAINTTTGARLWYFPCWAGGFVSSSPAVANGVVYEGSEDFQVYAFNAATGDPVWSHPTSGAVQSS